MLLGGLVGVGERRGKAASETRRQQERRLIRLVCSHVTSHTLLRCDSTRGGNWKSQATWRVSAGRRHWM